VNHRRRKAGLEALLLAHQGLWRPQPFKEKTPAWCQSHPGLTDRLLGLGEADTERLNSDGTALLAWLAADLPALQALASLIELPAIADDPTTTDPEKDRFFRDIPGRKRAQIERYALALGEPFAPLLEWCAGKGHLGRLLARRWPLNVASLEIDADLCVAGMDLARQAGLGDRQRFITADALSDAATRQLCGHHGLALHACGDLHRALIEGAARQACPAVDVAPCCYYRTRDETYRPLSGGQLALSRDDLRLAVTDTATASPLEQRRSRQAAAWKLGWIELRGAVTGEPYRSFKPVPQAWMQAGFAGFVQRMARREGLELPDQLDPSPFQAAGGERAARARRLELVRLAFRRAIEVWLVMDMACFLEGHGYKVRVGTFCPASLTPRNLLLSARHTNL
jgi:hypothetical protein